MSKPQNIAVWILQILLALLFLLSGVLKLMSNPGIVERFRGYGYPEHFYYVAGGMELLGALLFLIPRLVIYGGALLMAVMAGAAATHLLHHEAPRAAFTILLFALIGFVAYIRRPAASPR